MTAAPRILLAGDVLGRLSQFFRRVSSVNKSAGPFDALLSVDPYYLESPDQLEEFNDYLEGRSQIPIPTYFIGDYGVGFAKILFAAAKKSANLEFKMDGLKVCENLYWLRGSGKFTLHGVTNRTAASEVTSGMLDSSNGDSTLSDLVSKIKPRYHIAGTIGVYYDREPYVNVGAVHVNRFLALGSVGNKNKQKFLHALSPTPASMMSAAEICTMPPKTTLSPCSFSENASSVDQGVKGSGESSSDTQYWHYDDSPKTETWRW